MVEDCSICLSPLKTDIYTLSCNHQIHTKCYKKLMNNNSCFFISCPLCRDMNSNKPDLSELNDVDKLWFFCKKQRCKAINKKGGLRCKHKCHPLNYGYCYHHHKEILPSKDYKLMSNYLSYLYTLDVTNYSRLVLIDWGKKMLIGNLIKDYTVIELMEKYNMFVSYFKRNKHFENNIIPFNYIYTFYGIKKPPINWFQESFHEKTII